MKSSQNYSKKETQIKEILIQQMIRANDYCKIPRIIQTLFFFFGLLQFTTFIYTPNLITNNLNNHAFWILMPIARFDIAIYYFTQSKFLYLFPLTILFAFDINPLILYLLIKKFKIIHINNHIYSIYSTIQSIYAQLMYLYLYIPLNCILIRSLNVILKQTILSTIDIIELTIIGLCIMILLISLCFKMILYSESIEMKIDIIQQLNQSILDFLKLLLHIIQLVVFALIDHFNTAISFQFVLILLISLTQAIQIINLQFCNILSIQINLFINSFSIITVFIVILYVQDIYLSQNIETFQLVYTPLLYCVFLRYYQILDNFIIQRINRETKLRHLDYFFAKLFNNQFFEQQQLTILYIKSIKNIGQWERIQQSDIEVEEWKLQNIINKKMLDQFNEKMVKKYRKSINQQNKKINKINDIIHYLAILYNFGFINLAFHQSTNLMNTNSLFRYNSFKSKFINSETKQINAKHQIQNQRSSNMNQSSQNSKSSKTQELDELRNVQNLKNRKQIISQQQYISTIEYLKVQQLNEKIQLKMKSYLQQTNNTQNSQSLRLGVSNFLESEQQNESLKQSVLSFLNRKLQFFLQLQNQKTINAQRLFSKAKLLCFKMNKLEIKIKKNYEIFPSRKIQSVACYLQGEIMNNIFEAYKFKNSSAISDDKLLNMNKNVGQQFNSKDLVYLCLTMNEQNSGLQIVKSSDRAYRFFQCEEEYLKSNQNIDFLIPDFIRNEHQLLVSRFLANGQAKFYLNSERSFFRVSNQTVQPISFFFDICLNVQNELQFFGFFTDYITHNSFILVDVDGQIGGISQNLLQQVGLNANDEYIDFLFNNLQIGYVIPQFYNLTINQQKSLQFYTELQFLKLESIDITILGNNERIMKAKNGVLSWQDKNNLMIFDVVINIEQNELYGSYYSVIQIKEIKMNQSKMVEINSAIENCFQVSQLSEQEGSIHQPQEFKTKQWKNIIESEVSFFQQINPLQQFEGQIIGDLKQISLENFENILSPNQSIYPDTSKVVFKKQLFFKSDDQDFSVSQLQNSQKYSNQLNDLGDVDKNIVKDVMQQLGERKQEENNNKNEDESSSSSFAGIKRSPYYKKYEIMNLMLLPSFPNSLKTFIGILVLQILLSSIFCIISLVEVNTDLNRFVEEIDMIQLHAGIMVPHDLCVMLRVTLVTYQAYLSEKAITQQKYNELADPLYTNQYVGYYELQDNFIFQFDNRYLQDFFNDRNFTMYLMGQDGAHTYSKVVNIREALNTMYSYYYSFLVLFEKRMPPANQTFQVFQFANFYNFHSWLENLTLDILAYSKDRSNQVQEKWVITWISFLIPTFSLILLTLYYYLQFSAKYDRYLNLLKYCTNLNLQRDIDRYKVMVKLLNNNSESIFNYKFDLSMKEAFLNSEKSKFNLNWKNTKDDKSSIEQSNSISKLGRIALIFGFWIIFLIISTVSTQQTTNYVTKYSETTDLYKLIQDMSYSVGPIYLLRNIRLLWGNFTYLTKSDFENSYKSIYFGLDNIDKFYSLFSSFDTTKYQLSNEFVDYFFDVAKHPVCSMFDDQELGFLIDYCEKSLQGNLDKGLIPTLNYIKHQIENQMVANNFTKRIEYQLYENEGGLIVTRAFQKMTTKLKSGMLLVTNQSKSISNDVSIVYLIYAILLSFLVLTYLGNYLFSEYYLIRKVIQLIPSAALYFDDQMERNIRILIVNQDE